MKEGGNKDEKDESGHLFTVHRSIQPTERYGAAPTARFYIHTVVVDIDFLIESHTTPLYCRSPLPSVATSAAAQAHRVSREKKKG